VLDTQQEILDAQNINAYHVKYLEGKFLISVISSMDCMMAIIVLVVRLFMRSPVNVLMPEGFHSAQYTTNITKYGLHAKDKFEISY